MLDIRFPVLFEAESVGYGKYREYSATLSSIGFSGCMAIKTPQERYLLFFDSGHHIAGGVEADSQGHTLPPSEVDKRLEGTLRLKKGEITVYEVPSEQLPVICGVVGAQIVADGIIGDLVDIDRFVADQKKKRFSGYISVEGRQTGYVLMVLGEVVGLYAEGEKATLGAISRLLPGSTVRLLSTESFLEEEAETFSREHRLRQLQSAYTHVLKGIEERGDKGRFLTALRRAMLVESHDFPLLNPFFGIIEPREDRVVVEFGVELDEVVRPFVLVLNLALETYFKGERNLYEQVIGEVMNDLKTLGEF